MADFWWQSFCQFSPGKLGLNFVTENFATFFTARKEIYHLELNLGASSPNISLSSELKGTESTAIQIGGPPLGVLQYKLEVHSDTVLRSNRGWGFCVL